MVESFGFDHHFGRLLDSTKDVLVRGKRSGFTGHLLTFLLGDTDGLGSSLVHLLLFVIALRSHFLAFFHHAILVVVELATFFHGEEVLVAVIVDILRLVTEDLSSEVVEHFRETSGDREFLEIFGCH